MKLAKSLLGTLLIASLSSEIAQAGDVLDSIMSKKIIKVATDSNWPPQSFINDKNEMEGFDVDVAREIARRLGAEIEFITPSWDIIIAGNWNRRWDLHVGSMSPTKVRAEKLAFPAVYYYTPAAIAVHKNSSTTKVSDLSGKRIGTGIGTRFELYLQKKLAIDAEEIPKFNFKINRAEIRTYDTSALALDDLRMGDGERLEGAVSSMPAILKAIAKGYPIKLIGDPLFSEPMSVAIDQGDAELYQKIQNIIGWMHKDGSLSKLSKKWYGVDYTIVK